jgi:hypothetical protein
LVKTAQEAWLEKLATKDDLRHLEEATKDDLRHLEDQLRIEISQLRIEIRESKIGLLKWLIPIIIGQGAFVVALMKILKI